jgi:hypothetical protein
MAGYWAVARTQAQREQAALLHLERQQFEVYLPIIKTMRRIRGEPLFPGYIFIRIIDRWYSIMGTIGITHLLRSGEQPACCPDAVIDDIRRREEGGYVKLPTHRPSGSRTASGCGSSAGRSRGISGSMTARRRVSAASCCSPCTATSASAISVRGATKPRSFSGIAIMGPPGSQIPRNAIRTARSTSRASTIFCRRYPTLVRVGRNTVLQVWQAMVSIIESPVSMAHPADRWLAHLRPAGC